MHDDVHVRNSKVPSSYMTNSILALIVVSHAQNRDAHNRDEKYKDSLILSRIKDHPDTEGESRQ